MKLSARKAASRIVEVVVVLSSWAVLLVVVVGSVSVIKVALGKRVLALLWISTPSSQLNLSRVDWGSWCSPALVSQDKVGHFRVVRNMALVRGIVFLFFLLLRKKVFGSRYFSSSWGIEGRKVFSVKVGGSELVGRKEDWGAEMGVKICSFHS